MAGSDFTTLHLSVFQRGKGSNRIWGNVQMKRKRLAENLQKNFSRDKNDRYQPNTESSIIARRGLFSNVYKRRSNQLQALKGVLRSSQEEMSIITFLYSPHFYYLKWHIQAQQVMLTV